MPRRPNILFIVSDQHNAKVLGHKGHPNVQTPHLDRMAREGVRFDNAYSQNPICTPSRVSFLSGQYCHNHGYYGLSGPMPNGLPNILGYFRRHGYATAAIGKIHCPEYWIERDADVFHETCPQCSAMGRSKQYEAFLKQRNKLHLEDHISLTEFGDRGMQSMEGRVSPLTYEESQDGWIAGQTMEFMKKCAAEGRPFIAHASLPRPHQCTSPSEPFWSMYEGKDLHLPPNADEVHVNKAPHLVASAKGWRTREWALIEPKTFEAARMRKFRGYLGAVSQVDHAVGQMLQCVRDMGIGEETIVIYTSDHGDYACEHGLMEKAPGISHDAITRVPFIWWSGDQAKVKQQHAAAELAELVDVSATICSLAGLPAMQTSDGKDLSPLLRGESGEVRRVACNEFAWSKSIRKGKYRYVYFPREMFPKEYPDGFGELYDLDADPWEVNNLFFDSAHASIVRDMRDELLNWLVTTTRPVTTLAANTGHVWGDQQVYNSFHTHHNHDGKIGPDRIKNAPYRNYI